MPRQHAPTPGKSPVVPSSSTPGLQRGRKDSALLRVAAYGLISAACMLPVRAHAVDHPATRPMQFTDLMKMRRLGDSTLSPNGKWVLFSVTDADLDRNTRTSHLWVIPAAGGMEKPVTASSAGESRGRFSPDGKQILFISSREGSPQIYLASFDDASGNAGEAKALTSISTGADGALWSPDGQNILFLSSVYPECSSNPDPAACNKQRDDARANSKVQAQLFTHLLARHWNVFTGDKRSHLFLIPAAGGTLRDLNAGDPHDIPPFSTGGADGFAFSTDSKEIAFEENLDPEPAISTNADIFTLRLDDPQAKPVKISTSPGGDFSPAYSPDGQYIAWRSQARASYESDRFRLVLYDRKSKQIKEPLPNFDRWIDEFAWSADSKTIYFAAADRGEAPVFALHAPFDQKTEAARVTQLTRDGEYSELLPTPSGQYLVASKTIPRNSLPWTSPFPFMSPPGVVHGSKILPIPISFPKSASPISTMKPSPISTCPRWRNSGSAVPSIPVCRASSSVRQGSTQQRNIPSNFSSTAARKVPGETAGVIAGTPSSSPPMATSSSWSIHAVRPAMASYSRSRSAVTGAASRTST